ncbi:MAG: hypothetical protein ACYDAG_08960 [Chloroflexota bacterium]
MSVLSHRPQPVARRARPFSTLLAGVLLLGTTLSARAASAGSPTAASNLATLSPAVGPVTALPPVTSSDPRFGIVQAYEAPQLAVNAGARWERIPFFWNKAQPNSPSDWFPDQFQMSSAQLNQELAAGMQVVGQIGNPPAWATRDGSTPKDLSLPWNDPGNYWGQFVYKLAETYAGRVDSWIIWNEPDFPVGNPQSTWGGTATEYYELLKDASQAIKAANPKAQVIFAGTTYWIDVNAGRPLFFQRVLEAGQRIDGANAAANGYYFDAVDIHLYNSPLDLYRVPQVYRQVMSTFGINKPIWISEMNILPWDDPAYSASPGPFRATMSEQANFVIRGMAMALVAGVQRMSVYKMVDGQVDQNQPYGLVRNDGTLRPAYVAYQVAASHFAHPGKITYSNSGGVDTIEMNRGSSRTWMLVDTAPAATTASVPFLSKDATLTTKLGVTSGLPLPSFTAGQIPSYTVTLPGATNGMVGGDPVIVDQTNISDEIDLTPSEAYFPKTGVLASGVIFAYWKGNGGLKHFGPAVAAPVNEADRTIQRFANTSIEAFPAFQGTPYYVQEGTGKFYPTNPVPPSTVPGVEYFKTTGHNVAFAFLKAFKADGGLDVLGYPRTEAFVYHGQTIQFFQRGVMEYHPEAAGTANEVVLRLIGSQLTQGRVFRPGQPVPTDTTHQYFPETRHTVANAFLAFFNQHGGVNVLGYPISDEMPDRLSDGAIHTVQYFQRGRMEYHPELAGKPGQVSLGLLGDTLLKQMGWLPTSA